VVLLGVMDQVSRARQVLGPEPVIDTLGRESVPREAIMSINVVAADVLPV
jgi:hypothetical protein